MNDILKETFSKLEHKLDYGNQTELTNQEIAILLRYIYEIEKMEKVLRQRKDKALEFCNYLLQNNVVVIDGKEYYKHECDDVITNKLLEILKGDSND